MGEECGLQKYEIIISEQSDINLKSCLRKHENLCNTTNISEVKFASPLHQSYVISQSQSTNDIQSSNEADLSETVCLEESECASNIETEFNEQSNPASSVISLLHTDSFTGTKVYTDNNSDIEKTSSSLNRYPYSCTSDHKLEIIAEILSDLIQRVETLHTEVAIHKRIGSESCSEEDELNTNCNSNVKEECYSTKDEHLDKISNEIINVDKEVIIKSTSEKAEYHPNESEFLSQSSDASYQVPHSTPISAIDSSHSNNLFTPDMNWNQILKETESSKFPDTNKEDTRSPLPAENLSLDSRPSDISCSKAVESDSFMMCTRQSTTDSEFQEDEKQTTPSSGKGDGSLITFSSVADDHESSQISNSGKVCDHNCQKGSNIKHSVKNETVIGQSTDFGDEHKDNEVQMIHIEEQETPGLTDGKDRFIEKIELGEIDLPENKELVVQDEIMQSMDTGSLPQTRNIISTHFHCDKECKPEIIETKISVEEICETSHCPSDTEDETALTGNSLFTDDSDSGDCSVENSADLKNVQSDVQQTDISQKHLSKQHQNLDKTTELYDTSTHESENCHSQLSTDGDSDADNEDMMSNTYKLHKNENDMYLDKISLSPLCNLKAENKLHVIDNQTIEQPIVDCNINQSKLSQNSDTKTSIDISTSQIIIKSPKIYDIHEFKHEIGNTSSGADTMRETIASSGSLFSNKSVNFGSVNNNCPCTNENKINIPQQKEESTENPSENIQNLVEMFGQKDMNVNESESNQSKILADCNLQNCETHYLISRIQNAEKGLSNKDSLQPVCSSSSSTDKSNLSVSYLTVSNECVSSQCDDNQKSIPISNCHRDADTNECSKEDNFRESNCNVNINTDRNIDRTGERSQCLYPGPLHNSLPDQVNVNKCTFDKANVPLKPVEESVNEHLFNTADVSVNNVQYQSLTTSKERDDIQKGLKCNQYYNDIKPPILCSEIRNPETSIIDEVLPNFQTDTDITSSDNCVRTMNAQSVVVNHHILEAEEIAITYFDKTCSQHETLWSESEDSNKNNGSLCNLQKNIFSLKEDKVTNTQNTLAGSRCIISDVGDNSSGMNSEKSFDKDINVEIDIPQTLMSNHVKEKQPPDYCTCHGEKNAEGQMKILYMQNLNLSSGNRDVIENDTVHLGSMDLKRKPQNQCIKQEEGTETNAEVTSDVNLTMKTNVEDAKPMVIGNQKHLCVRNCGRPSSVVLNERSVIDQEVPTEDLQDCHGRSDEESLYPIELDGDKALVWPHSKVFKWKYVPSLEIDRDSAVNDNRLEDEDSALMVVPLKTCSKPLRIGLSRKQSVKTLHPQLKRKHEE